MFLTVTFSYWRFLKLSHCYGVRGCYLIPWQQNLLLSTCAAGKSIFFYVWKMTSHMSSKISFIHKSSKTVFTFEWSFFLRQVTHNMSLKCQFTVKFLSTFLAPKNSKQTLKRKCHIRVEQSLYSVFYSPTNAQVIVLKNNIKIYIKIALTCFGTVTPSSGSALFANECTSDCLKKY